MSKYEPLWRFLQSDGSELLQLSFERIEEVIGFEIDHSFLTYKKEAANYGYHNKCFTWDFVNWSNT